MGNCKYCGKPAGLLRSKHQECEVQYLERLNITKTGQQKIIDEVFVFIKGADKFSNLENEISAIEKSFFIESSDRERLLIKGWENAVESFLEDGILDTKEENRLVEFQKYFNLSQADLNTNGTFTKIGKASVLRDILDGKIPQKVSVEGNFPINFQKGEHLVWVFPNSSYLEDKTRRTFEGGSQGVSIRIMKGVYYRAGAFKGQPVNHNVRVHVDDGWFAITDKNLYFAGPSKSIRIPYSKIVSFEPFSDGIGLMRDATTAKPQIFVTGDGWFTYNLATNLAKI